MTYSISKKKKILFYILDIVLIILMTAADRFTKILAAGSLKDKDAINLIPGVLELRYLENRGAAFGMLQNQKYFFIIVGVVFLIVIFTALIKVPVYNKYRLMRFCLCMISAGAIGNLYDRVTLNYVIDFIYFVYINFPIFNVADCYVTISTAILLILFIFVFREDDLNMKKANTPKIHSSMINNTNSLNSIDNPKADDNGGSSK